MTPQRLTAAYVCGLAPAREKLPVTARRQARIDRWADHLRGSLNLDLIRGWIELK